VSKVVEQIDTVLAEDLPPGWSLATIEDLVGADGVFVDGDWVESKDQDPTGDVRLIQLADIGDGEYRNKSDRFLTSEKAIELGCTFLMRDDVLIARMPDPLGRACIFPGDQKKSVTVVDVAIVRSGNGAFNHRWLMYFINAPAFRTSVASLQSGSTRKRISRGNLARISLPVPPHGQQNRIVAEIEKQFSRLDEAVANLKRVKANLKRYKAAVLKAAVEGKLTEDWREQHPDVEPASKLLERILAGRLAKWNGKGKYKDPVKTNTAKPLMLPVEWEWTSLDSLTAQIGDVDHKMPKAIDGGIPYISTKDFTGDNQIDFDKAKTISITDYERLARKIKPEPGDILLSRYGTVGETRVVPTKPIFQASYSIAILKPLIPFVNTKYLPVVLRSQQLKSEMSENVRASSQPDLGLEYIRKLSIPLPSLGEQELIVAEVERRLSVIEELEVAAEANLTRADRLRQSVLRSAFSGRLVDSNKTTANSDCQIVSTNSASMSPF
jgi:type I restriction enzyme S subunit